MQDYLSQSSVEWVQLDETARLTAENMWRAIYGQAFRGQPRHRHGVRAEYEYQQESRIDYLIVTSTAVYSIDHTVNLGAIEAALPCQHLPPTSFTYVPGKGPRYTCAPQGGLNVGGMVLVKPYPQGFRLLQVSMPAAQDAVAAQILAGFH